MSSVQVGDMVRLIGYRDLAIVPPNWLGIGWRMYRSQSQNVAESIRVQYAEELGWWVRPNEVEVVGKFNGKIKKHRKKPLRNRVCRAICATLIGGAT